MKDEITWQHDKLAEDLALAIGPTPFLNVHLGSLYMDSYINKGNMRTNLSDELRKEVRDLNRTPQRADVIKIAYSYTQFSVAIYEIKISRADFLSDIRSGKWRGYLDHCHRFYFAVAQGIAKKEEIPEEAGLIVRGPKGWSTVKASEPREVDIPKISLMSMLFARQRLPLRYRNVDRVISARGDYFRYGGNDKIVKVFGKELAEAWVLRDEYMQKKMEFESLIKSVRRSINEGLAIDDSWPEWELSSLVREIKEKAGAI